MSNPEYRMAALPARTVREALTAPAPATVLLPLGSHEDHGPGAPMGDYLLAEAIALRIAARAAAAGHAALVAPALPFGGADFFTRVPGGMTLSQATLRAVLDDLLGGLTRQGIGRVMIVNGHGGNLGPVLDATRAMRERTGALVPTLSIWKIAASLLPGIVGAEAAKARLGHGADPVLSISLALFGERTSAIAPPPGPPPQIAGLRIASFGTVLLDGVEIDLPIESTLSAPHGVFGGDPTLCDAATGAALVAHLSEIGAALVARIGRPDWPLSPAGCDSPAPSGR